MSKRKPIQSSRATSHDVAAPAQSSNEPLAIVGMGCLFPKADSLAAFWGNIRAGVDCITPIPASHWKPADYFAADAAAPDMTYAQRGGFLDPYPFDPLKYGISPNNLEATDATQLLGMVVAEQTLRDAGYATAKDAADGRPFDRDRTSVILGVTGTLQLVIPLGARLGHPLWRKALAEAGVEQEVADDVVARISAGYVPWQENSFPGLLGNVAAGRIANRFDLGGTNCVVDAACASSLSALHMAAMELHAGRADMVLTGGFDAFNDIFMYMCFSKTPALSPTGDSRPFSANGDGTILGEGLGMVALKRLADAQRDGDRIYALIRGIGSSSDGRGNAIYAPSPAGQVKALRSAYAAAGVSPATIELVEAHGTGTKVGDLAEATSLGEVYRAAAEAEHAAADKPVDQAGEVAPWCAVGSVKSMIGHTKAAAGVAGLIKAALALSDKVLPPTLKVEQPLDPLSPGAGPAYVNTVARPWPKRDDHPRRAALSAFGFGGSNFHCVLEEATANKEAARWDGRVQIVPLAGATIDAIAAKLAELEAELAAPAATNADNATSEATARWKRLRARAAQLRGAFDRTAACRLVLVIDVGEDPAVRLAAARRSLAANSGKEQWSTPDGAYFGAGKAFGKLAVLFPGQGSQYVGMLREAGCVFPQMLATLDDANAAFGESTHGARLSDAIYPIPVFNAVEQAAQEERLRSTDRAQPALAAVEWGAWNVLRSLGVEADAFAGHSFGELVALAAAGRIDAASLHKLAVARGSAMAAAGKNDKSSDAGAMLAVVAPIDRVRSLLAQVAARTPNDIVVANHNSPEQVVLSGGSADIDRIAAEFAAAKIRAVKLPVSAAFHSPRVASAQREFAAAMSPIAFRASSQSVIANTTGDEYPTAPDEAKALLAAQLARPVEFVRSIETLYARGVRAFVEVGPQGKLTSLVRAILGDRPHAALSIDSTGGRRAGLRDLAAALAEIAALGHRVELAGWDPASETPAAASRGSKPGLIVPLSGVNYVKPRPALPPRAPAPEAKPAVARAASVAAPSKSDSANQSHSVPQSAKGFASHNSNAAPSLKSNATPPPERLSPPSNPRAAAPPAAPLSRAISTPNAAKPEVSLNPPVVNPAHVVRSSQSPRNSMNLDQALRLTEQSILAMERMQQQTAQLQQQYLEGQLVAQKTVEQLVAQQQWLLGAALGAPGAALPAIEAPAIEAPPMPPVASPPARVAAPGVQARPAPVAKPVTPPRPQPAPAVVSPPPVTASPVTVPPVIKPAPAAAPSNPSPQLGAQLLEIVSDKTGYPVESLDLSMSLDADLGIDSIKRVEIMSAVQERMPEAPIVRPEDLGRLQTLGAIVDFLTASAPPQAAVTHSVQTATAKPPSAAPPPQQPSANSAGSDFANVLIEVVADKTGYPAETLELDMRLDADLGIDSIKRVEILSALQERMPDAPLVRPDDLGRLQTLRQIVAFLDQPHMAPPHAADPTVPAASLSAATTSANSNAALENSKPENFKSENFKSENFKSENTKPAPVEAPASQQPLQARAIDSAELDRRVLRCVSLDASPRAPIAMDRAAEIWITDDGAGLAEAIRRELIARRVVARVVSLDAALPSGAAARSIAGLCIVAPAEFHDGDASPAAASRFVAEAFALLRRVAPALRATGRQSAALLATVTQIDGKFGLVGAKDRELHAASAITGALAGMVKTASHEWPEVHCKAIDVALPREMPQPDTRRKAGRVVEGAAAAAIAASIAEELSLVGPLEVGLDADARYQLALADAQFPAESATGNPSFAAGDVIVVTGGARGVAAEAAVALAEAHRSNLVLLGRSPDPVAEPDWAAGISNEPDLKRAIVVHHSGGAPLAPKAIDFQCKRILANREIAATLARISAAGAAATYRSVDVRDAAALRATLAEVRRRHGPIRGIVHAAGVLADRLIEDKTDEQFAEVWSTKVDGAIALLDATAGDDLRGIAFFSSSTARFGRKGQVDYAAANEALNKLAQQIARARPACRVVSVNWGPWDGGMVTPALKKLFESEGVGVIGLDAGARQLVAELAAPVAANDPASAVEVVILGKLDGKSPAAPAPQGKVPVNAPTAAAASVSAPAAAPAVPAQSNPRLALSFERELSVESCPVLRSHVMNDRAVLPMALVIEWLAHAAMHDNPGQNFLGFDDLRVYKGVILDADTSVTMRVLAAPPDEQDGVEAIAVELHTYMASHTQSTLHARARVLLGSRLAAERATLELPAGPAVAQQSLYDGSRLFHGPELHALASVDHCSASGISALARCAPPPAKWLDQPLRGRWLADPMALDAAFQLLIVWCFENRGSGSLPTRIARYRQFAAQFPGGQSRIIARIDRDAPHETTATIEFTDEAGKLIARIEGYECVVDGSLNEAFTRNQLPVAIS